MAGDEVRNATKVVATSQSDSKLPFLVARPGNLGVQIDTFRSMKVYFRPRCGKFTAHFLGMTYENHSLENYSRTVDRTQSRARIVSERLEKLQQREVELQAFEQRRRQRRRDRENAEQRRQWLLRRTTKKAEQRDREDQAALTVQRIVRGYITRRCVHARRVENIKHNAATCLQTTFRAFVRSRRLERRRQEVEKERNIQAALTIQRYTRKLLRPPKSHVAFETKIKPPYNYLTDTGVELDQMTTAEKLEELLGCDDNVNLLYSSSSTTSVGTGSSPNPSLHRGDYSMESMQPRRPLATFKRVGGGFRQSNTFQLRPSGSQVLTLIWPHQPQHHHPRHVRARPRCLQTPRAHAVVAKELTDNEDALLELVELLDRRH